MQKELEIAQVNEMKFYLNWDYVKEICSDAIREENSKLKELLKEIIADADLSHCDSDIELRIDEVLK